MNPLIPIEKERLKCAALAALETIPNKSYELRLAFATDVMESANSSSSVPINCQDLAIEVMFDELWSSV